MNCNRAKRLSYTILYDLYGIKIFHLRGTISEYQMLTSSPEELEQSTTSNRKLTTDNGKLTTDNR